MLTYTGRTGRHSVAATVAADLAEAVEALAVDLLGRPDFRTATELRWGENAKLRVVTAGPHRGRFANFATGERGDALDLVRHALQSTPAEALAWARAWLGAPATRQAIERAPTLDRTAEVEADAAARVARAAATWSETSGAAGSLVEVCLRHRRVWHSGVADLRYHANCRRGPFTAPAMVALLRDLHSGEPCGIHRTYLAADGRGKADRQAKRMLGRAGGAAVMLSPFEDVTAGLAICEGIETGMALLCDGVAPIWATASATGMRTFPVLAGVESLTIYADHDASGISAAEACAERWRAAGREVRILMPDREGADFADLLTERAA